MQTADGAAVYFRFRHIRYVLVIVLVFNWGVAFAKIVYGYLTQCASMTADGFHSLSDGASNIIGLVGIHLAAHPKDEGHPYGHKKFETLFSMAIAAMLFVVAINLAWEGIEKFHHPVAPEVNTASFVVMFVTLAVNIAVMTYEFRRGRMLKSDILVADATHTKADIFTTLSVLVTLVAIKMGYPILDPIVTVLIAFFIAYAGFDIVKHSAAILCDRAAIQDVRRIEEIARSVQGVISCHKIRTRGREDEVFVDMHCQLEAGISLEEVHQICHQVEIALKNGLPEVSEVMVHPEPCRRKDVR